MHRNVVLVAVHRGRHVSGKTGAVFASEVQLPQSFVSDITHLPVTSILSVWDFTNIVAPSKSLLVLVGIVPLVAVQAHAVILDTCLGLTSAITLDCSLAVLRCHVLLELSCQTRSPNTREQKWLGKRLVIVLSLSIIDTANRTLSTFLAQY